MNEVLDAGRHTWKGRHGGVPVLVFTPLFAERYISCKNLTQGRTKAPNVAFYRGCAIVFKAFRGHIGKRAAVLFVIIASVRTACLGADAKIGDGIVVIVVDKDVGGFDVLMNDLWLVGM